MIDSEKLIKCVFPYYGYLDECWFLMSILSEETRMIYHDNLYEFHRLFKKRTLYCHYPLFERMPKVLDKNYRWAQYKLVMHIKFPKDYPVLQDYIESHYKVDEKGNIICSIEFESLNCVITEDSIEPVNGLIKCLKRLKLIDMNKPESMAWFDVSNYSLAANMKTKILYDTEMIIGARPSAYFDKTVECGLIDVRKISKCPYQLINFPVHAITADADFCFEIGKETRKLHKVFINSVKNVVIEDKLETFTTSYEENLAYLKIKFFELRTVELTLEAPQINEEDIMTIFTDDIVSKINLAAGVNNGYVEITAKNIYFVVGFNSNYFELKAGDFSIQFEEGAYKKEGDFIIINPSKITLSASNLIWQEELLHYKGLKETNIEKASIILHSKFVQDLKF